MKKMGKKVRAFSTVLAILLLLSPAGRIFDQAGEQEQDDEAGGKFHTAI
jgi:hypothetical protein